MLNDDDPAQVYRTDANVRSWGRSPGAGGADPLLCHSAGPRLCSSCRQDNLDSYAINTGNEMKVGLATFLRPNIPT